MTIERTIEITPNHRLIMDLPSDLPVGRVRVELKIIPEKVKPVDKEKSAFGCLHHFANPMKIFGEKGAWERAVLEKYGKN